MFKIEYSPQALQDLQNIKIYIAEEFSNEVAASVIGEITKDVRRLELFPVSGMMLSKVLDITTDYYFIYSNKNYVFYRLDENVVKIIRVLNEQQDYVRILFDKSNGVLKE